MIKAGIVGASGYTGIELLRLLINHPEVEIKKIKIISNTHKGKKFSELYLDDYKKSTERTTSSIYSKQDDISSNGKDIFRYLDNKNLLSYKQKTFSSLYPPINYEDIEFSAFNASKLSRMDVVFAATPHGASMKVVPKLLNKKCKVIDLSGDFRLLDKAIYEKWYGMKHTASKFLGKAIYGLPEINREAIKKADFVASPGCYPTASILALAPMLKEKLIFEEDIIIDAKSGVSGAGKVIEKSHLYMDKNSIKAYGLAEHKHTPEMEQELSKVAEKQVKITFTPHLIPMSRGILATCYADLKEDLSTEDVLEVFKDFYKDKPFVEVLDKGVYPETKNVMGSNYCHIGLKVDERTGRVIVVSAIDNLTKGASGQAIQNMNLMCGLGETEGLKQTGIFP